MSRLDDDTQPHQTNEHMPRLDSDTEPHDTNELQVHQLFAEDLERGPDHERQWDMDDNENANDGDAEAEQPSETEEQEDDEFTLLSSVERPVQTLNLNGVSASQYFFLKPLVTPIVFENNTSEARDLDANERNYLSMLRLTLYLALAGVVVLFNFRLPVRGQGQDDDQSHKKIQLSEKVALPLGIVFCVLAILGLIATMNNYISTLVGYAKQRSVVQTTALAQLLVITSGATIFAANIIFLMYN